MNFNFPALASATNPTSTAAPATGFGFGAKGAASAGVNASAGSSFSFPAAATASTAGSLGFATKPLGVSTAFPSATTTAAPPSYGLKLGIATTTATGLTLGSVKVTSTPSSMGFTFPSSTSAGQTGTTAGLTGTTGGLTGTTGGLTGTTAGVTGTTGGLKLGTGGLTLGSTSGQALGTSGGQTGTTGGLTFGNLGSTASGLLATKPATTTATTTTSGGLTLGGLGGTSTVPTTSSTAVKGLGGVDPATSAQNASKTSSASGDGKRVKEEAMPNELVDTVTKFKEYVKEQKDIAAKISIISNQQMNKVEEQTSSLKHLLSTVTVGLHRNVVALDKLKKQTSQELRNVEMAHRTKETPAGLQYENHAPNQYFYELLESFDSRMALYRKLIEDTEGYLVGAQQGSVITPKDLFVCLKKLHETFIALAAQLQGIHEQIKEQKDQYLAYRKIFHNDETDVFEKRKKVVSDRSKLARTTQPLGPTPFTGLSNYAAMMMSAAMNRQTLLQQPGSEFALAAAAPATQPPTAGLFGGTTGFGGFGSTATQPSGLFGAATAKPTFGFGSTAATTSAPSLFGFPSSTAAATRPSGFGFGTTTTTSAPTAFGFGAAATSKPTGFGFGSTPATTGTSLFGTPSTAAVKPLG